jgi:2-aminoadipate transaminase
LAAAKYLQDLFTNSLAQVVVERFWRRGLFERHVEAMRQEYCHRRDVMASALRRQCPQLSFARPGGGFFFWAKLPLGVGAAQLLRLALQHGVSFMQGSSFHVDGHGHDHIRLTFPSAPPAALREGIKRLGTALRKLDRRPAEPTADSALLTGPVF